MGSRVKGNTEVRSSFEELEGCVLFSAGVLGSMAPDLDADNGPVLEAHLNPDIAPAPASTLDALAAPALRDESTRRELIFVDCAVQD